MPSLHAHPLTASLAAALACLSGPVLAASPIAEVICAPSAEMSERLTRRHGVTRQGLGLRDPESRMELWSSEDTGDWTLVIAYASGQSCIVSMGQYWEDIAADPA